MPAIDYPTDVGIANYFSHDNVICDSFVPPWGNAPPLSRMSYSVALFTDFRRQKLLRLSQEAGEKYGIMSKVEICTPLRNVPPTGNAPVLSPD